MREVIAFLSVIFLITYIIWLIDHYITNKQYPFSYAVSAVNHVVLIALIVAWSNYEQPAKTEPQKMMKITIQKAGVCASTIEPLDVTRILQLKDSSDVKIELL